MNTITQFGLSVATLNKLNSVFERYNAIGSVLIYGSRAKGNYHPGSDIDLTIKGDEILLAEFLQIEDQIDDLMLPYTIDLSQYSQLGNADLIAHIDRVGVEIYAKNMLATKQRDIQSGDVEHDFVPVERR